MRRHRSRVVCGGGVCRAPASSAPHQRFSTSEPGGDDEYRSDHSATTGWKCAPSSKQAGQNEANALPGESDSRSPAVAASTPRTWPDTPPAGNGMPDGWPHLRVDHRIYHQGILALGHLAEPVWPDIRGGELQIHNSFSMEASQINKLWVNPIPLRWFRLAGLYCRLADEPSHRGETQGVLKSFLQLTILSGHYVSDMESQTHDTGRHQIIKILCKTIKKVMPKRSESPVSCDRLACWMVHLTLCSVHLASCGCRHTILQRVATLKGSMLQIHNSVGGESLQIHNYCNNRLGV